MTPEQLEKLRKIFQDPDWQLVKKYVESYISPLVDIRNVDNRDNAVSVKGEIKARIEMYNLVVRLFTDSEVLSSNQPDIDKNSME